MAAAAIAEVNATLLTWAREQSGYSPESAAKRVGVRLERLDAWERGDLKPTVRQAQELAKYYHRPFGVFFLQTPPVVTPLAAEYRRLPGIKPSGESPEFRLAVRVMQQRRTVAMELADELGQQWPVFGTGARLSEEPAVVGQRLRQALGLSLGQQFGWRDEWQAWREWRAAAEGAGVLVFQFPGVPLAQARGLCLFDFPLPVVGINSKETAPGARVYSLLHELVHVALAVGHDEQAALKEHRSDDEWAAVERFAEEAASEALVPAAALGEEVARVAPGAAGWNLDRVRGLARRFRVTPLAMATRLRSAGVLGWAEYREWKAAWDAYLETLSPPRGGFATPVDKTLGRAGRPFTQLVLEALDANRITAVDASRYLDLRFDHISTLRAELGPSGANRPGADDGE